MANEVEHLREVADMNLEMEFDSFPSIKMDESGLLIAQ